MNLFVSYFGVYFMIIVLLVVIGFVVVFGGYEILKVRVELDE